jgi:predicted transcriptional regulator
VDPPPGDPAGGLGALRRGGAITELLFVYECATIEPTQLRPIAARLGQTVQAASYTFRQLRRRGLIEQVGGRYRPTVRGVAWLHETLDRLGNDVRRRIDHLHVIRSTRAVALDALHPDDPVSLELVDGLLSARRGTSGASRGRALAPAGRGELVEVGHLEGIVPIVPATISIRTVSLRDLRESGSARRLAALLARADGGLLAAEGLEAYHLVRESTERPVARFAVAAVCREASQLGVPSTVIVLEDDLPRLLAGFSGGPTPPLEVLPLTASVGRRPRRTH